MSCGSFIETILQSAQCILVLVAATLYRAILFLVFLSASVGPATLVCYLYVYVTGREPYPEVQPAICMMLISCWAEFSIGIERRFCNGILDRFKSGYPGVMSFGRFVVHFAMYIVAFCGLYLEFEKVHTIPEPHKDRHILLHKRYNLYEHISTEEERLAMAKVNEPWHVTIFLFSLAYLVFVTSRNFQKDLFLVLRNLPSVTFSLLNNWLIRIVFAIIHTIVNLFYFLPCLAIAYTSSNYKTSGLTTYFQLCFTAGMAGMIAALFELNRPWPQRRGQLPFLFYENNMFGKNLLAHALVVNVLYFFYKPKNHPKVLESRFDSTNRDVLSFCLVVAFTTLHIVKFGVHAVLSLAHEYDQRMNAINNVVVDIPEVRDSGTRNQAAGVVEHGGMCARCIANMINNNSHSHPPPTQSANQICDTSRLESELGARTSEEVRVSEAGKANEELQQLQDNENNDVLVDDNVAVDRKQKCSSAGISLRESCNSVNKIKATPSTDCQRHQSCKNLTVVDLTILNESKNCDEIRLD